MYLCVELSPVFFPFLFLKDLDILVSMFEVTFSLDAVAWFDVNAVISCKHPNAIFFTCTCPVDYYRGH